MVNYLDLPAYALDCESLTDEKFIEVLTSEQYHEKILAFKQGVDGYGNITLLIILAPTQETASKFATDLGQKTKPMPITPLSAEDY